MLAEDYSPVSANPYLIVEGPIALPDIMSPVLPSCPVIGIALPPEDLAAVDVALENDSDVELLVKATRKNPLAAATMVQVLRHNERCSPLDGLLAESLAYSTLQQSAGFKAWLASRKTPSSQDDTDPLIVRRETDILYLTLNRPKAHNAYNEALKDALCQMLQTALTDETIREVRLSGSGPSYCAGGDLTEFGRVSDAGEAHLSRTTRGAAALLVRLVERQCHIHVDVQGACIGAGIELPAYAQRIEATQDAFFQLPEVDLGLIPGAGGTVSILKRIGRHRTAYMALSNKRIDAETALQWGLIDEIKGG